MCTATLSQGNVALIIKYNILNRKFSSNSSFHEYNKHIKSCIKCCFFGLVWLFIIFNGLLLLILLVT